MSKVTSSARSTPSSSQASVHNEQFLSSYQSPRDDEVAQLIASQTILGLDRISERMTRCEDATDNDEELEQGRTCYSLLSRMTQSEPLPLDIANPLRQMTSDLLLRHQ